MTKSEQIAWVILTVSSVAFLLLLIVYLTRPK